MNPLLESSARLLRRIGFAIFGGVLLALVFRRMMGGWAWGYLHSNLVLICFPVAITFSFWLFGRLPRKAPAASGRNDNAQR